MVHGVEAFFALFENLAIFIALVAVYGYLLVRLKEAKWYTRQIVLGLTFGVFAVGCMYARIPVFEGVRVDQRNAVVVVSGVFGGPVSGFISAAMAGAFRVYLGGDGVVGGLVGVTLAAIAGAGLNRFSGCFRSLPGAAASALVAMIIVLPGFLFIKGRDLSTGWELLKTMWLPYGSAIFLGILIVGLLLRREEKRYETEVLFRESEEKYRELVEGTKDLITRTDEKGSITFANHVAEELLGLAPGDCVGVPVIDFVHPNDRAAVREWFDRCVAGKSAQGQMEVRLVNCATGRSYRVLWSSAFHYDGRGNLQRVGSIASDVTKLRQMEENYRNLFEKMPDGYVVHEVVGGSPVRQADYRFVSINPAMERITGLKAGDVLGRTVTEVLPEDRKYWQALYGETASSRGPASFENYLPDLERYFSVTVYSPAERQLACIFQDITERKRAEGELQRMNAFLDLIVENIPHMIFIKDARDLRYVRFNRAGEDLLGISRQDLLGKNDYDFFPEGQADFFARKDREALSGKSRVDIPEESIRTRDKGERVLHTKKVPILNAKGEPEYLLGISEDITERKRLEAQLMQAQKMEAIGTLAGGIAHDFNNLLMGIQGNALIAMLDLDPYHPHYARLKGIEEQVRSAADLTSQLLGFASGGRYETRPVNMNDIIGKTILMFARTKKELSIHEEYAQDLRAVEADRGQIEQVLLNLLVNAWHAMPSGGDIRLRTRNVVFDEDRARIHDVPPGEYVEVSVSDTGTGMSEDTRKRIFDPFFTTKGMGRGTGLGLAMVYGIVRGHRGHITVSSEPDRGSTFTMLFPASEKEAIREGEDVPEVMEGSETILLVDDEPNVLSVSREILEALGYTVYSARDGYEAVALYRERTDAVYLIILDMIMPGLSGSQTFDRLREINPQAKILLSSGYSLDGQAQQIMDRGCRGFVQKPFNISHISRKIREVLDH